MAHRNRWTIGNGRAAFAVLLGVVLASQQAGSAANAPPAASPAARPTPPATAPAQPPAATPAPPVAGPRDEITAALATALDAYTRGEVETARSWVARASTLLDDAARHEPVSPGWPTSNASQLLEVLRLYALFVRGTRPDLDVEYETLVEQLQKIDFLNTCHTRPARVRASRVEYHLITHLVTRIGNWPIEYHLLTQQITRVGDTRVDYDLLTRMPVKIGGIAIDYDLIDGDVRTIAGVNVR